MQPLGHDLLGLKDSRRDSVLGAHYLAILCCRGTKPRGGWRVGTPRAALCPATSLPLNLSTLGPEATRELARYRFPPLRHTDTGCEALGILALVVATTLSCSGEWESSLFCWPTSKTPTQWSTLPSFGTPRCANDCTPLREDTERFAASHELFGRGPVPSIDVQKTASEFLELWAPLSPPQ